jgi:hypothetical protein
MQATLLIREKTVLDDQAFFDIVIWQVPQSVLGSAHGYKYSLAYVTTAHGCVLRYDNERGKGDHRHDARGERPYRFTDLDPLIDDFFADMENLRS